MGIKPAESNPVATTLPPANMKLSIPYFRGISLEDEAGRRMEVRGGRMLDTVVVEQPELVKANRRLGTVQQQTPGDRVTSEGLLNALPLLL